MNERDEILLSRIRLYGDDKAFEYIFHSYYATLCNFAFGILKNKSDAEDVVNDCFFEFWSKREIIEINTSLKSYLFISARNAAINKLRKKQIENKSSVEQKYLFNFQDDINQEIENLQKIENLEKRLTLALEKLPQQCRYIFYLNRFEDLSYKEIAKKLGVSPGTVKTQIGRALKRMRAEFSDVKSVFFSLILKKQKIY